MKFDKKSLIKYFKKGWLYMLAMWAVSFVLAAIGNFSIDNLMNQFADNPAGALGNIFTFGLLALAMAFVILPIISGIILEWVNKKIK